MRSLLYALTVLSLPLRGAWIEILRVANTVKKMLVSLPLRGAWIEIRLYGPVFPSARVAPPAGSVD